jgi:hypothetical protein
MPLGHASVSHRGPRMAVTVCLAGKVQHVAAGATSGTPGGRHIYNGRFPASRPYGRRPTQRGLAADRAPANGRKRSPRAIALPATAKCLTSSRQSYMARLSPRPGLAVRVVTVKATCPAMRRVAIFPAVGRVRENIISPAIRLRCLVVRFRPTRPRLSALGRRKSRQRACVRMRRSAKKHDTFHGGVER